MKKVIAIIVGLIILTGCDVLDNFTKANTVDGEQEHVAPPSNPSDFYADLVTEIFDESNDILSQFNSLIDRLYASTASEAQFAQIVNDMLPRSNDLLKKLDEALYIINDDFYGFHKDLITLVNFQHQLLLEAIKKANSENEQLDLNKLRSDYVKIKQDQTILIQKIKSILQKQSVQP
ncbi:hypothetical protein AWH56_008580 [Anaerobacillus isosaccharinicus]|uniref:Lipoprotein n=1 Tax=Anaerobacillus isosaccharinicus TaxID=1532552 RepID=A0A1S2L0Z8_9BACI|nr:hypothetical protein [Anaerobacillus isosaccharinicus]MBA5583960.1 hypothetical protein [Anaerobacillus isosaccharinicus]QOY37620.1 hypothetical protein AWH56_008580 [Anaerobacillus isosaccharinicus]